MEKNIKMKDIKELGEQLGELQRVCREKKIPVMIAFEGYGAAGKGLQIGNLIQALDPRGFKVYAVKNETEEEWMHPFMWRFWTKIPEKGRIAIFDTSWYSIYDSSGPSFHKDRNTGKTTGYQPGSIKHGIDGKCHQSGSNYDQKIIQIPFLFCHKTHKVLLSFII